MKKSIALFDIDNTLCKGFSYLPLLEKQSSEGTISRSYYSHAIQEMNRYKSGLISYEEMAVILLDIYAVALSGKTYQEVFESTIDFYQKFEEFFPYVQPVFTALKPTHDIILVTAEPQFAAAAVQKVLGSDAYESTTYEVSQQRFTGKVSRYLAHRSEKHEALKNILAEHSEQNHSFAFGDSEGDLEILEQVAHPICINATPGLQQKALSSGWQLTNPEQVEALVKRLIKED